MNEKIDIIKKCFYEMQGDYWRDEGIAAAERMAAEIERLEKANSGLAETFGGLSNEIIYYKHEFARLKAELERLEEEKTLLIKFSDEIASHCQRRESEEK